MRRAIKQLADEGLVQSVHGKGVIVLYNGNFEQQIIKNGQPSFNRLAKNREAKFTKRVLFFDEKLVDTQIAKESSFPVGTPVFYIKRIRILDGEPFILQESYFLKKVMPELTLEIAQESVYDYLIHQLSQKIATTRRILMMSLATADDHKYLNLGQFNTVPVITNYSYLQDGTMFEYTKSRHQPKHFIFYDQATSNPVLFLP
ncbi:GntR family transcriptional regulator [Lactiplantibacillus brownii]